MQKFMSFKDFYDSNYQRESIKLFVFEMNKNSQRVGLKDTHFANPTGLSNSKNYSTARDMAVLTSHCLKNHLMREIFRKKVYTCEVSNQKLAYTRYLSPNPARCSGGIPTNTSTSSESASAPRQASLHRQVHVSARSTAS
jgi:hypothetical protein